jgi:hypothetical protein
MVNRCTQPCLKSWPRYGGRGIRICERWQDFENFLEDMGECPSEKHTLDRFPNNDGNYELSNCRWATWLQQHRNHSAIRWLTFKGETLCAAEWSQRLGINQRTIYGRMNKGQSDEMVLGTPVKFQRPRKR